MSESQLLPIERSLPSVISKKFEVPKAFRSSDSLFLRELAGKVSAYIALPHPIRSTSLVPVKSRKCPPELGKPILDLQRSKGVSGHTPDS